jgi:hypothetical protein
MKTEFLGKAEGSDNALAPLLVAKSLPQKSFF